MNSFYQKYKKTITQFLGKVVDFDGVYANQCVDWAKAYAKAIEYPITTSGDAKAFATKGLGKYWKRVVGAVWEGDIVIFPSGTYGHIAVVSKVASPYIEVIDQNANGNAYKNNNSNNLGSPIKLSKYKLKGDEVYYRVNS